MCARVSRAGRKAFEPSFDDRPEPGTAQRFAGRTPEGVFERGTCGIQAAFLLHEIG